MNRIKHSKFKNTAILFELLVRQVTADILKGTDNPAANKILRTFFKEETELGKELKLYQLLMNETANDSVSCDRIIDTILKARQRIRTDKLNTQKYNLIKEIKQHYPIDDFLRGKISNYKLMASIYKLFESCIDNDCDPVDIIQSRKIVSESVLRCSTKETLFEEKDKLIEAYERQTKDLKLLSHKLLVDSFNKKYSSLDDSQKVLLREFINNVSNTNSFKSYINKEIPKIQKSLVELAKKSKDTVIEIKINETCNQLETLKKGKIVKENHVMSLLLSYELIKELKSTIDG